MIEHLPPGSALSYARGDGGEWSLDQHLIASVFDALNHANWQRGAKKGAKPPSPLPRPTDRRRKSPTPEARARLRRNAGR